MELDELLQHLTDLRDLAASEAFLTFADALDDVLTFVEAMPARFDRRLVELLPAKRPIAIDEPDAVAAQAAADALAAEVDEEIDRAVAALERERRSNILPKRRD